MEASQDPRLALLLGRDHVRYGAYDCVVLDGAQTVCTISVGKGRNPPSLWSKGGDDSLNEDAMFAVDDGRRVYLGVADAHFGYESSHYLIESMCCEPERIPADLADLAARLRALEPATEGRGSETTLLLAIYDRESRQGFGITFGDCSLALVDKQGARIVNVQDRTFIAPADPGGVDLELGLSFHFFGAANQLLLAYSDGINECHYHSPATSVRERHLHALFQRIGASPERYARELTSLALGGVEGNPGGQDNLVLAVSRT